MCSRPQLFTAKRLSELDLLIMVEGSTIMMTRNKTRRLTVRRLVLEKRDVIVGDDGIIGRPVAGRDHIGRISHRDRGQSRSGGEEAQWLDETKRHDSRCV